VRTCTFPTAVNQTDSILCIMPLQNSISGTVFHEHWILHVLLHVRKVKQSLGTGRLYPQEIFLHSFLLEAESTPRP
jgi:hypothetical protein